MWDETAGASGLHYNISPRPQTTRWRALGKLEVIGEVAVKCDTPRATRSIEQIGRPKEYSDELNGHPIGLAFKNLSRSLALNQICVRRSIGGDNLKSCENTL